MIRRLALAALLPGLASAQMAVIALRSPLDTNNDQTALVAQGFGSKVSNNAVLSSLISPPGTSVTRLGFSISGDGPPVVFTLSGAPCSLNGGAGDGGSQIKPNVTGGCWIANISSPYDPRIWGCRNDGITDCLPALNAIKAIGLPNAFNNTGAQIQLTGGQFYISASFDMSHNGLTIIGAGPITSSLISKGNYPVITGAGSYTSALFAPSVQNLNIVCGGRANANADGIVWSYADFANIAGNSFYGCNKAMVMTGQFLTYITNNNVTGSGTQQSNICLEAGFPTDVNDTFGNNALIVSHNLCQFVAGDGARLINANGSLFDHNQWIGLGGIGVHACEQPSATYPSGAAAACEFLFFDQDQTDTTTLQGWTFKQGSGNRVGPGIILNQPWASSNSTAAVTFDGADHVSVLELESENVDSGIILNNVTDARVTGRVFGYNKNNNASHAVLLSGTTSLNLVNVNTSTSFPISSSYNGIVETGTFSQNRLYAGQAACAVGLAFGGASVGLTYSVGPSTPNQCVYDVNGLQVRLQFYIGLSAVGSSTGAASLTGLPVAPEPAIPWGFGASNVLHAVSGFSGLTGPITSLVAPGTTTAGLYMFNAAGDKAVNNTNFTSSSTLVGTVEYTKQ
jgi:hypothetical protein